MVTWKSTWRVASDGLVHLHEFRADSWNDFAYKTAPSEAVEQDFAFEVRPHLTGILGGISTWTNGGDWPKLSDGARHCGRLNVAATFGASHPKPPRLKRKP